MKSIAINPNLILRREKTSLLALQLDEDKMYLLKGDIATLVDILSLQPPSQPLTIKALSKQLQKKSKTFSKNSKKDETLAEALAHLRKIKFIAYAS